MLLCLSLGVALIFFIAFIVSVRRGQFDDTYTPSVRMLFEDELVKEEEPVEQENFNSETKTKKQKSE